MVAEKFSERTDEGQHLQTCFSATASPPSSPKNSLPHAPHNEDQSLSIVRFSTQHDQLTNNDNKAGNAQAIKLAGC